MTIIGISGLAGSGKDTVAGFLRSDSKHINIALADPLKRMCREAFDFSEDQLWGPSEKRNAPDKRYPRAHTWESGEYLKEVSCACCGQTARLRMVEDDLFLPDDEDLEPCYLTPRFALQKLGTEFGRACYPNVWVDMAMRTSREVLGQSRVGYLPTKGVFTAIEMDDGWHPAHGVSIPDVRFRNEMYAIRAGGGKVIRVVRPGAGLTGAVGKHPSETEQMGIPDDYFDQVIVNDGNLDDLRKKVAMAIDSFS